MEPDGTGLREFDLPHPGSQPRIIALVLLNRLGIRWFNGLPIVAFATSPRAPDLTSLYSFRLAVDFGAPGDYQAALGRSTKPAATTERQRCGAAIPTCSAV